MPKRREWVLDPQITPTNVITRDDVAEALAALQIRGVEPGAVGTGAQGKILVAIVKHLAQHGFTGDSSVLTTPPSILCSGATAAPERPTKDEPVPHNASSLAGTVAGRRRQRPSRAR